MTGSAVVAVNARPTALVSGSTTICNGQSATITAVLSGSGPWSVTWSDGVTQSGVSASPATRSVSPSTTTTYTVTALSDANCTAQAGDRTGSAVVTVGHVTASASGTTTICLGASTTIQAALTGSGPWSVDWSDGYTQTTNASPATRVVTPSSPATRRPAATSRGNPNFCPGGRGPIRAALTGVSPWTVAWSDGFTQTTNMSPAPRIVSPSPTTVYSVTNLPDSNCTNPGTGTATV